MEKYNPNSFLSILKAGIRAMGKDVNEVENTYDFKTNVYAGHTLYVSSNHHVTRSWWGGEISVRTRVSIDVSSPAAYNWTKYNVAFFIPGRIWLADCLDMVTKRFAESVVDGSAMISQTFGKEREVRNSIEHLIAFYNRTQTK